MVNYIENEFYPIEYQKGRTLYPLDALIESTTEANVANYCMTHHIKFTSIKLPLPESKAHLWIFSYVCPETNFVEIHTVWCLE